MQFAISTIGNPTWPIGSGYMIVDDAGYMIVDDAGYMIVDDAGYMIVNELALTRAGC